ncbi:helix-turn-helix domain-containing protein [Providencia rettgeri]|uniref:helix-turn-helix domain-containing protein n=1 Tax=Providencia sp. TaxID=589 RepID=UPI0024AA60BA|nr:helix-turn-helix transcriptional regulator [Providencia rettgeri]ELR5233931.1 helix-turn-helix transcriptional regulator [Providencia rettgeri]
MQKNYPASKLVGRKITYYRKMKGIPLSKMANDFGISEQQQSRYERGINRINLDRLAQYVNYFEINFYDLLSNKDIKELAELK